MFSVYPLTREVNIITPNLWFPHSSHPEPPSFLANLFQASVPTQVRMSCSFSQPPDLMDDSVKLQNHLPCESFPDLCHLPVPGRMDSFIPHTILVDFQNYTYHCITKASLHACLPLLHCKRLKGEGPCHIAFLKSSANQCAWHIASIELMNE